MLCPDCQDSDSLCLACDGSGSVCDLCGEPAEDRGAAYCFACHADSVRTDHDLDGDHDPLPDHIHVTDNP